MRGLQAVLLVVIPVWLAGPVGGADYDDVVIFGDSFSDTGNLFAATAGDLPADPPYDDGRFSDGPLWIEGVADGLGLVVDPVGDDGTGNNYAVGASLVSVDYEWPGTDVTVTSVTTQLAAYLADVDEVASADTLYVVFSGHNDVRLAAAPINDFPLPVAEQVVIDAAQGIADAIADLADAGAVHFLVPSLANLGVTPLAVCDDENTELAEDLSRLFNEELDAHIGAAREHPDLEITTLDMFQLTESLVNDARNNNGKVWGLTNADEPALADVTCGGEGADPDVSVFIDSVHPTTAAHELLAGEALLALGVAVPFQRGDGNGDGDVALGDATFALGLLFVECGRTLCPDALDTNDDGLLTIGDPILLLTYLFLEGSEPASPFGECDPDPTPESSVGCSQYEGCD